jgi:hypothetical protein
MYLIKIPYSIFYSNFYNKVNHLDSLKTYIEIYPKIPPITAVINCITPILDKNIFGKPTSLTKTKAKIYNNTDLQTEENSIEKKEFLIY